MFHVNLFSKSTIDKNIMNIKLMDLLIKQNCNKKD